MSVTKSFLLSKLPAFKDRRRTITENQTVKDIIKLVLEAHEKNAWLYDKIGLYFIGADINQTCENLYQFCAANLKYVEESDKLQLVSVPQAMLTWGHCDCKGYASFICGVLAAIERKTGEKLHWEYCFASYKIEQRTPYHVFAIVETDSGPLWIDPTPGAANKIPVWWYKRTVKNSDMALQEVIGKIGDNADRVGALNAGVYYNQIPALKSDQQQVAANVLLSAVASNPNNQQTPIITQNLGPAVIQPPAPPADNTGVVPAPTTPKDNSKIMNTVLLVGGGLGLLYLLSEGGNKVGGKKKKRDVLPILLIGGALAYWWFTKDKPTAPAQDPNIQTNVPATTNGGGGTNPIPLNTGGRTAEAGFQINWLISNVPYYNITGINSLTNDEVAVVYHYEQGDMSLYSQVAAINSKYNLNFTR